MDVVSATVFLSAAEPVKNEETFESDALELKGVCHRPSYSGQLGLDLLNETKSRVPCLHPFAY